MSTAEILNETYFTPTEAAGKLRLQVRTVWKHIRLGNLKALGGRKSRRIAASELARFLAGKPDGTGRE